MVWDSWCRFRAKREHLQGVEGLLPESQGQNLAVTVLDVPRSLDSGAAGRVHEEKSLYMRPRRLTKSCRVD